MCFDIEIGLRCAQAIATILGSMVNILQEGSLYSWKINNYIPQVVPHVNLTLVETLLHLTWKVHFGTSKHEIECPVR